jgi:methylaspartate mutase epsilon subunit
VSGQLEFGRFIREASSAGSLVVQPRMGFSDPAQMRDGLRATRDSTAQTVGTITVDSYTRTGDHASAARAVANGEALNGYPLVTIPTSTTRNVLADIHGAAFPVQVRHGSARPQAIVDALVRAGLTATEGGPVSYCLPYGRTPLRESVANWAKSCEYMAENAGGTPHMETFGGCLMGQLCPPSLLIAMSVLEGMFFVQHGITDISLSYAQQTSAEQDIEAITALHRLGREFLRSADRHVVLYAYMGVYPQTTAGALALLEEAARIAVRARVQRLIVKTVAEAHRIPTIAENVEALSVASDASAATRRTSEAVPDTGIYSEAHAIISTVLDQSAHVGLDAALVTAFRHGLLDVPFCLHPDNVGLTSSYIDGEGWLRWADTGALPIGPPRSGSRADELTSADLLDSVRYVERRFDEKALPRVPTPIITEGNHPTHEGIRA